MKLGTAAARLAIRVAQYVVQARPAALVVGYRDTEENATLIAAALGEVDMPVTYLCDDPVAARRALDLAARFLGITARDSIRLLPQRSARGVWAFLRSEVVFHTHGVYGSPPPRGRRMQVLLGHGHGPKAASPRGRRTAYRPTVATTNNRLWGTAVLKDQGVADAAIRVTGNPRDDVLTHPAHCDLRTTLGIPQDHPVVWWLPTYRSATVNGRREWIDAGDLTADESVADQVRRLGKAAAAVGVTVIVSTHSLDDSTFDAAGLSRVTEADLCAAGITFYQLLADVDAVISDYSSVWVDFLRLDQPVALWCPDLDVYGVGRGFNEPGLTTIAGELLVEPTDFENLFAAIATGQDWRGDARRRVTHSLGLAQQDSCTRAVLGAVAQEAERLALRSADALAKASAAARQAMDDERNDPTYVA